MISEIKEKFQLFNLDTLFLCQVTVKNFFFHSQENKKLWFVPRSWRKKFSSATSDFDVTDTLVLTHIRMDVFQDMSDFFRLNVFTSRRIYSKSEKNLS